jgi:O-antigen/teichoic acid export membrane protein
VMIPYIAEAQAVEGSQGTKTYHRRLLKISCFLSLPALFILLCYGQWFIGVWLGPDRFIGGAIWWTLCFWMFIHVVTQPGAIVIMSMGYQRWLSAVVMLEGIASLCLGVIFVKYWGIGGVAAAGLISAIMTMGWFVHWYAVRITGDSLTGLVRYTFLPGLLCLLPAVGWQIMLNSLGWSPTGLITTLAGLGGSMAFFFLGAIVFGLNAGERASIINWLRNVSGRKSLRTTF